MDRLQYSALMIACLLLTLPLEFVFGARVWRQPKRLVRSVVPVALFFLVWDLWATNRGDWGFNPKYTIGWKFPGGMVVEEILFFVAVPVCALLTLEAVSNMLAGTTPLQRWWRAR
ncbi:MAG: lycopene cyclase domain-containing protein [Ilumatobacteraceae bacterium]|nr:lycopene cyclase domain-containing protein [Ilumatobacteraceae bacterium]